MPVTEDIAIVWRQFGPYHMDRCEALGERLKGQRCVYGIEIAPASDRYAWSPTPSGTSFEKTTLFDGTKASRVPVHKKTWHLLRACAKSQAKHIFLCNFNAPDIFLCALMLRAAGWRVYIMQDSKFDDLPRKLWREVIKALLYLPYCGALVSGPRTASYLRFLGFRNRPVAMGYDTVSMARLLAAAGQPMAPEGPPFAARYFVLVARFIPKKDIATAIAAYARYREIAGEEAREFHICGSGPLEAELHAMIDRLNLDGVVFHGFVQSDDVACVLARGLALVLPSVREPWGLVVNEALAFGLPILATDNVGARDLLLRTGVNGYVFEPRNVEGLAHLMSAVAKDEDEWRRLVRGSRALRAQADTGRFVDGVLSLVEPEKAARLVEAYAAEPRIDPRYE